LVPCGRAEVVPKAGHMGPISHSEEIAARIASHIRLTQASVIPEETVGAEACAARQLEGAH